jgi:phage terminase large subunit
MARQFTSWSARLAARLRARAETLNPTPRDDRVRRYRDDPVMFAREILGMDLTARQREIISAVRRGQRVSVASGHKVGKSTSLAVLALWFFCSFPGARVVITATTDRQVNGIIWKEVKRLVRQARVAIPGAAEIKVRASSGLDDPETFAEIRGYTASEAEAIAGISGEFILYLVDEASGVDDRIFEAIEGNRAGGNAWVFLISNPTRGDGVFYDSHHRDKDQWIPIHVDSRESPNVTGEWRTMHEYHAATDEWLPRTRMIPGMAVPAWVEEKLRNWGEDDPRFKMRVAGVFTVAEEAKVFQLAMIVAAQSRWEDTQPSGRLQIGVDPAGDGDGGDESAFVARRGNKVLEIRTRAGMSEAQHLDMILDVIATHNQKRELKPVVALDSEGEVGWKVYCYLSEYASRTGDFTLMRVRTSNKAVRQPLIYDRLREEVYANAREWVRRGGAIPEHEKLEDDLHAPEFTN